MLVQSIDNFTGVNPDALVVSLFEGESSHIDFVKSFRHRKFWFSAAVKELNLTRTRQEFLSQKP